MYSDHRLHDFALHHNLHDFLLDDEAVLSSAKCQLMVELLRDLQVCFLLCIISTPTFQTS